MTKKITSPYEVFGTDKTLEADKGVTLDYPGFSITIKRAGGANKDFARVLNAKMKPHRQRFERGLLDEETSERIMLETYAESVVVGWENVTDKEGNKLEFNVENVKKLFTDLPDLYADVKDQAHKAATFKSAIEEIEEKN